MILTRKLFLTALIAIGLNVSVSGAEPYDPFDLNLEQNINTPTVPSKNQTVVKEHIDRLRVFLDRQGFKATKERRGEVLMITIPCEKLFRSNSTALTPQGQQLLKKFSLPEETDGLYKILIAVHSDDTGENGYTDNLTAERANAIDDFFSTENKFTGISVVPYGIGRDEPLVRNDSVKNRAKNRRVEIYIVPEQALFSKRKS